MTAHKRATAPSGIVVDASVLAKIVIHEAESDAVTSALAHAARAGVPLLVLPLTRFEVGDVLVKLARRAERGAAGIDIDGLVEHSLALVETRDAAPGVADLARVHGLSYYDASYLALATAGRGRKLWTCDARLGKAAESGGRRVTTEEISGLA
ncbi:MAG: type II toxin-antitoxin system VapC family toxin [Candidatus Thermoplasmatota archaeon]